MTIVSDARAVDPIAYIRAVGLVPEDCYGFVPLDVHDAASFQFVYRERFEYSQARAPLAAPSRVGQVDLGMVGFGWGEGRKPDVEVPSTAPSAAMDSLLSQVQALQQSFEGLPGAPDMSAAAEQRRLEGMRATGAIDDEAFAEMRGLMAGGHAGPEPGGVPAAAAPPDAPALVVHRLFPPIGRYSTSDRLDDYLPAYRDALALCPEDVYGVWPRRTRNAGVGNESMEIWDDYWILYRDRPHYEQGRVAWAERMGGAWPPPEVVPGVAPPGTLAPALGSLRFDRTGDVPETWPCPPEDAFGLSPGVNGRGLTFAWRAG